MLRSVKRQALHIWWYAVPSTEDVMHNMSLTLRNMNTALKSTIKYLKGGATLHHLLIVADIDDAECLEMLNETTKLLARRLNAQQHTIDDNQAWEVYSICTSSDQPVTMWKLKSCDIVRQHVMPHLLPNPTMKPSGPTGVSILCIAIDDTSAMGWIAQFNSFDVHVNDIMIRTTLSENGDSMRLDARQVAAEFVRFIRSKNVV